MECLLKELAGGSGLRDLRPSVCCGDSQGFVIMLCSLEGKLPLPFGWAGDANCLTIVQPPLLPPRPAPSLPSSNARCFP